jgi:hypothetical protein
MDGFFSYPVAWPCLATPIVLAGYWVVFKNRCSQLFVYQYGGCHAAHGCCCHIVQVPKNIFCRYATIKWLFATIYM